MVNPTAQLNWEKPVAAVLDKLNRKNHIKMTDEQRQAYIDKFSSMISDAVQQAIYTLDTMYDQARAGDDGY